jgi:hypothetical protein
MEQVGWPCACLEADLTKGQTGASCRVEDTIQSWIMALCVFSLPLLLQVRSVSWPSAMWRWCLIRWGVGGSQACRTTDATQQDVYCL